MSQPDLTPSALSEQLSRALKHHFPEPVWVRARLLSFKTNKGGYGNWVITDDADSPVKIDVSLTPAVVQRTARQLAAVSTTLSEHLPVRIKLAPTINRFGKLACELDDIDVGYSAENSRLTPQQVFEKLTIEGLAQLQQRLPFDEFPLRLVVIGSDGSDGVKDALAVLEESNIAFRILPVHAPVQGPSAPRGLQAALELMMNLPTTPDAVLMVRGGGDRGDLIAFDDLDLARAVCRLTIPVVCGIGHEADTTVCDLIAHRSERTPTGAASWLVNRVRQGFEHRATSFTSALSRVAERLDAASLALEKRDAAIDSAISTLDAAAASLAIRFERAVSLAENQLAASHAAIDAASAAVDSRAAAAITAAQASLDVFDASLRELHPDRALERGFAIVRHEGSVLRTVELPKPASVTIQRADGTLDASVS